MPKRPVNKNEEVPVTDPDVDLFEDAVRDIKPLDHNHAAATRRPVTAPVQSPEPVDTPLEFGDDLRFLRPGIQVSALQKLRKTPVDATLDLHGLTVPDARDRLSIFLEESRGLGRQTVRIVHGKGLGSPGRKSALKATVNILLQQSPAVLAFRSAQPQHGGTGAVDVLLRKS